ncbi:MAG: nucleotidyltransferase domain-containing protein, partial [Thermoplasmata archaeon]
MKLASDLVLPDRARKFLDELSNALENYEDKIVSIILFGSLVKGGHSALSDVDMIIVVKDEISDSQISEIEEKVRVIEEKNEYRTKPIEKRSISERFVSRLGSFVELRTGMFVSHFICRRKDFLDANFAKIFNTTPVVTELLAPSSLVLSGVLSHAKTIYGEELLNKVKRPEFGLVDILKSLIMNFLLSLGSLFLYIFHSSAGKFAFE